MKYILACLLFALVMDADIALSAMIYDGGAAPFASASGWDSNGSTLSQKNVAPHSNPNHIRANLVMKNWWGAVAYVPKGWNGSLDISKASSISFWAKANKNSDLLIQLYDGKQSSSRAVVKVTTGYQKFTLPVSNLSGIDQARVTAIVFAMSQSGSFTRVFDIDDIEMNSAVTPTPDTPPVTGDVRAKAIQLVRELSGGTTLMVGEGGVDATKNGLRPQIHYQYLCCGYGDKGWRGWNQPSGEYATMVINNARAVNAIPMFTYYQIAYEFEIKNYAILTAPELHQYLLDIKMMFTKLGAYGGPSIVHLEPDFFGYLQQYAVAQGKSPSQIPAKIRYSDLPECQNLPETVRGMLDCMVTLGRKMAPKAKIGFHASGWGDWYDSATATPDMIRQKAASVGNFLRACGSDATDFVTLETTDRDAGFLEATRGAKGAYWDDTNATKPNFTDHFIWVKAVSQTTVKPILWWQMPFGVPSTIPGGTDGHYRDNRVRYFFSHTKDIVDAGGFGMVYGAGAEKQTMPETDGGQFKRALDNYLASPQPL